MSKKRFIYHGYLQIAELDAAATESAMSVLRKTYLWDPLEPAATRILAMSLFDETGTWAENLYYTHDLLKNTTALFGIRAGRRALYEYGPYGNILRMEGNAAEDNPFRFSSEYADDELGLVYYNYRYYNPQNGRWISRDPAEEEKTNNLYWFVRNNPPNTFDILGRQCPDMSWVQPAAMDAYIKCIENYSKKLQDCLNDCENRLQAQCGGWLNSYDRAQQSNSSIGGPSVEESKIQGILFIIALAFIFVEYRNCKLKCKQIYN